jgi:hypothetical protein
MEADENIRYRDNVINIDKYNNNLALFVKFFERFNSVFSPDYTTHSNSTAFIFLNKECPSRT